MFKFFSLLLITSCSFFIERIETPLVKDPELLKAAPEISEFCPLDKKVEFQLVGTNDNSQNVYLELTKKLNKNQLDFMDHFVLWNLMQLSIRPDQSSPTSRIQILLTHSGKNFYFDFFSEDTQDQYPLLYGLEWILKKFGKKSSLEHYARLLDSNLGTKLKLGKDFENFLIKNISAIRNNQDLAPYYIRGTDILKQDETSPVLNYSKLVGIYRQAEKKQKIIINTSLTHFETEQGQSGSCNYDFNLYENSIFLIDKVVPVANLFGLSLPASAFLASTSQKLDKVESLKGFPLFKGESKIRSSAVCMIENEGNKIWAISNQSRDPGQHLFHLVRYGLPASQSVAEVDRLIRHSRHLFLSDPVRLVIESELSSQDQIENLLKLNLPIYNADKLGNIWAYAMLKEGSRFIIDKRNSGTYSCQ